MKAAKKTLYFSQTSSDNGDPPREENILFRDGGHGAIFHPLDKFQDKEIRNWSGEYSPLLHPKPSPERNQQIIEHSSRNQTNNIHPNHSPQFTHYGLTPGRKGAIHCERKRLESAISMNGDRNSASCNLDETFVYQSPEVILRKRSISSRTKRRQRVNSDLERQKDSSESSWSTDDSKAKLRNRDSVSTCPKDDGKHRSTRNMKAQESQLAGRSSSRSGLYQPRIQNGTVPNTALRPTKRTTDRAKPGHRTLLHNIR